MASGAEAAPATPALARSVADDKSAVSDVAKAQYALEVGATFGVAPRSFDSVSGLPVTERGFGTGPQGCNGVVCSTAGDTYRPCHRKANTKCRCPTGSKCSKCCAEDWWHHAKSAMEEDDDAPAWSCAAHGGVDVPSEALRARLARERERIETAEADSAARSPPRRRAGGSGASPGNTSPRSQEAQPIAPSPPRVAGAVAAAAAAGTKALWTELEATAAGAALTQPVQRHTTKSQVGAPTDQKHVKPTAVSVAPTGSALTATVPGPAAAAEENARRGRRDASADRKSRSRRQTPSGSAVTLSRSPSSSPSRSPSPSSSSSSTSSSDSGESEKRAAKKKAKKRAAKKKTRASRSAADADATPEGAVTNRTGDAVAADRWLRAQQEDSDKGSGGGSVYDRARQWCHTTPGAGGLSDIEGRNAGKRAISLFEYLVSADAKRRPGHALRVAARAMLREAMAARCWHTAATETERKARQVILYRGVAWSKETRKAIDAADVPDAQPHRKRGGGGAANGADAKSSTGGPGKNATGGSGSVAGAGGATSQRSVATAPGGAQTNR